MAQAQPLVSIVLPTFNRPALLREAVESALRQSYTRFELVIVDDGSEVETGKVVADFQDVRIRYARQERGGRSAARNTGLTLARGEFVAFLDDDDLFLPDKLARQVAFLESNEGVGLVAGGAQIVDAAGGVTGTRRPWLEQPELTLARCLLACPLLTCAVLARRDWFNRLDGWFDTRMDHAEDTDLWLRLLAAGCQMAWDAEIVCAYRQHGGNSQGDREAYSTAYLFMLDKLFSRNELPAAVRESKGRVYARYHALAACQAYERGDLDLGRERLLLAASACPDAVAGAAPALVDYIAHTAGSVAGDQAAALIKTVFDCLPPELAHLRPYRRQALGEAPMRRVFEAARSGQRPQIGDWLRGTWSDPRRLRNPGVWSILVKDIALGGMARRSTR